MLCGWLSPEGKFYPCDSYGHIRLSWELARAYYRGDSFPQGRADDFLLTSRWVKLYRDGLASANPLTDKQVEWLDRQRELLSFKQERAFSMYLDWDRQTV